MRNLLIFIMFFSIGMSATNAQTNQPSAEEEKAIKALVQGVFDDVWSDLDASKLLNYHTEDFFYPRTWGSVG